MGDVAQWRDDNQGVDVERSDSTVPIASEVQRQNSAVHAGQTGAESQSSAGRKKYSHCARRSTHGIKGENDSDCATNV